MQTRLPISKPLLLVLIGLIIGASLGLGSGYAVFYPSMVRERSQTFEERVGGIEGNVTLIGVQLTKLNTSMAIIGESMEGIIALSDVIEQISERVSAIETGQVTFNSELDDLEGTLNSMNEEFVDLTDEWDANQNSFEDLETAYYAVNNELDDVQTLVRENDGIRIFTSYMANPSGGFKDDISDEVYDLLKLSNTEFADWVLIYTESTAKLLLRQEMDDLMGELVWNPSENVEVGSDTYQVKLESYFNFEFTPAGITVSKMHIEVRATINIDTVNISSKAVTLTEIV
jgi:hypothetical protein